MSRTGGRRADELRTWKIVRGVLDHAEGSALIEVGKTRVMASATVEERLPPFLKGGGKGWVTAEYSMLPRSTHTRTPRERGAKIGGRTLEIQRLIGRSLRCVTDLRALGERTITLDCDVIQADGGTRCASVTAAWVALYEAFDFLGESGVIEANPAKDSVAAVSVGIVNDKMLLDLDYGEDSAAEVDMNVVLTGSGRIVEIQATAEREPFSVSRMNALVKIAQKGLKEIASIQRAVLMGQE